MRVYKCLCVCVVGGGVGGMRTDVNVHLCGQYTC